MKLDRSTYEAWLLDRIEGRLTPEQERELDAFLAANPDLASDVGDVPSIDAPPIAFTDKNELKRALPPTGPITVENLSDYLVARSEGDLGKAQQADLDRYLYEHPETAREARFVALARVAGNDLAFGEKETVQRHFPPQGMPDAHRLSDFLIAEMEGDLTTEQTTALRDHLTQHPEVANERRLLQLTRIPADLVMYPHRASLKKREARVITLWPRMAAAASIALLLGLAWWVLSGRTDTSEQVAGVEKTAPAPTTEPHVASTPEAITPKGEMSPSRDTLGHERPDQAIPERVERSVPAQPERVILPVPDRLEPLVAESRLPKGEPAQREVEHLPPTNDPPTEFADARPMGTSQPLTVQELFASTVRNNVIGNADGSPRPLEGADAVALVDKGLDRISNGEAGVKVERQGGSRWTHVDLRLGRNLAITASR